MRRILKTIISRNVVRIEEKELITETLWRLITNSDEVPEVEVIQNGKTRYIYLKSIPEDLLRELGFNRSYVHRHLRQHDLPADVPACDDEMESQFAELDVSRAMSQIKEHRHEFVDHFIDDETIERKALTLALLKNVAPNIRDGKYLKSVFKCLVEKKVSSDLPLKSFTDFYKKLKWYCKVGWSSGCLE